MRHKTLFAATMILAVAACTPKGEYRIHGYTTDESLNGAQIFLVPMHDESPQMVDSVHIENNRFEFKGHGKMRQEWMAELRLEKDRRIGYESLLVVTEPGDIYVNIGKSSSGYGTPQNDSLQVWKELTVNTNIMTRDLRSGGHEAEADSIRAAYVERSRQMGVNLGAESTLGAFIQKFYPPKKN